MSLGELPIRTSMNAYWKLNGNSNDASGNANNGTDTSMTYNAASGYFNEGASFNGSTSKIVLTDAATLKPTSFSISLWLKNVAGGATVPIGNRILNGGKYYGWNIIVNSANGNTTLQVCKGTGTVLNTDYKNYTIPSLTYTSYRHIVYTYDGTDIKAWSNGIYQGAISWASGLAYYTTHNPRIGCLNEVATDTTFYNGLMDEVILDTVIWDNSRARNYYTQARGMFCI